MTQRILTMMVSGVLMMVVAAQPAAAALLPDAPTLVQPEHHSSVDNGSPVIAGLAPAGTRVAVYIDDTFNGYATPVSSKNGVQSFKYTPFLPLTVGTHTVMTRAEDVAAQVRSRKSRITRVTVEPAYPAPMVLNSVVNEETTLQQPWIVGVAPSGATIDVWIDGTLNGSTTASIDDSGTGSFRYKPFLALARGQHTVTAMASTVRTDSSTRRSAQSEERVVTVAASTVTGSDVVTVADSVTEEVATDTAVDAVDTTSPEVGPIANTNTGETIAPAPENATPAPTTPDSNEAAESSAEPSADTATPAASDDATSNNEPSNTRTVIGWLLLIIAAVIIVVQMRQRRNAPTSGEMQFGPAQSNEAAKASTPAQPTSPTASQSQLELHAPKENKNVQLVEKTEGAAAQPAVPSHSAASSQPEPTQPTQANTTTQTPP